MNQMLSLAKRSVRTALCRVIGQENSARLLRAVVQRRINPLRHDHLLDRTRSLQRIVDQVRQPPGSPPAQPLRRDRMEISWVIPDFLPGAGGHMTIFRIASLLEQYGHRVRLLIQNPLPGRSEAGTREMINRHFQPFHGEIRLLGRDLPALSGDALIATDRFTCYVVDALSGFRRKFYFVQDYETQFYPMGAEALLTENTYTMGFDCLCAGDWLAGMMRDRFGSWAMAWSLSHDRDHYHPRALAPRSGNRIAFYSRYATARRAVELGIMGLDLLHRRGVDFHVDFYGATLHRLPVGYPHTRHGVLSSAKLGDLYRRAAVGMVFSATNHSLANKEMMACGLPVIDLDVESVRAIFPPEVLHRVRPTPEAIADGLQALLADAARREALSRAGLDHVERFSWEASARQVEAALAERMEAGQ